MANRAPKPIKNFVSPFARHEKRIATLQAQVKTLETIVEGKLDALAVKNGDILLLRNVELGPREHEYLREIWRKCGLKDVILFEVDDTIDVTALSDKDKAKLLEALQPKEAA